MQKAWARFISFWAKYQRHIGLGGLAFGFSFDLFLAKRPDSVADNVLLLFYLFFAAAIILALNMRTLRRNMEKENPAEPLALLLILQFCFGGLANNLLILYGKSGTIGGSFLFVGILLAFALGNEFLKGRYEQLRFNVAVYYFLLLTYCVIAVPTFLLHRIGTDVFLMSSALSLGIILGFLSLLHHFVFRRSERGQLREVAGIALGICLVFNGLYFLNIIPPVPLSLKEIGIYHSLAVLPEANSAGDIYTASYEKPAWYVFWRDTSAQFTTLSSLNSYQSAYCYSAVFAPGGLGAPIVHRWEKYNTANKNWETRSLVSFPINGGRDGGYRGYSIENSLTPGAWRCNIETGRGALVGRISFTVAESLSAPALSTTTL
ncbi:MAG: DUF2914 domain-containing protein [bacterium]